MVVVARPGTQQALTHHHWPPAVPAGTVGQPPDRQQTVAQPEGHQALAAVPVRHYALPSAPPHLLPLPLPLALPHSLLLLPLPLPLPLLQQRLSAPFSS